MFKLTSSPHTHSGKLTARIMLWVIAAMIPALGTQIYFFGFGVLFQSFLAIGFALILELIVTYNSSLVGTASDAVCGCSWEAGRLSGMAEFSR